MFNIYKYREINLLLTLFTVILHGVHIYPRAKHNMDHGLCSEPAIAMALTAYPCPVDVAQARFILKRMLTLIKRAKAKALDGDRRDIDYATLIIWLPFCWAAKCRDSRALYEFDWRAEVDAVLGAQ